MDAIPRFPALLDYLAYVYFSPNCMTGPILHFREVEDFFHDRLLSSASTRDWTPRRRSAVIRGLYNSALWVLVYLVYVTWLPAVNFMSEHPGLAWRFMYMIPAPVLILSRLLCIWSVTELACIVMGIAARDEASSDEKTTINVSWDRCVATDVVKVFSAGSPKMRADLWNSRVSFWLRTCVYDPTVQETGSSTIGRFLTLFVSAIWHVSLATL